MSKYSKFNFTPNGVNLHHLLVQWPIAQQEAQESRNIQKNMRTFYRIESQTNYSLCIISDVARRILMGKSAKNIQEVFKSTMKNLYWERKISCNYHLLKPRLYLHECVKQNNIFTKPSMENYPSRVGFLVYIS